ncbi:hypothetical protein SLS60_001751 [Paraconiothyrium brasiliense]|uniref:N-acetyltransferase domain-containing protein n=1 Tax=Paraconiothyrium brasiliense TaxID=300254 RepID=A0ABR3S095_9PLEO
MYEVSQADFLATLHRNNYIYVKAVDEAGNIVGHAGWGLRGVDEGKILWKGPDDASVTGEERAQQMDERKYKDNTDNEKVENGSHKDAEMEGIDRLYTLEDTDMQHMMASLMPPGTSCMYIVGLIVSPEYQSHGVGSALIKYGNAIADRLGVFTWVHSSDQAWKAYAKFGFEVVKELEINLDGYAPSPPGGSWAEKLKGKGEGVTEARWGTVKHPLLSDVEALGEISDTPKIIFGRPTLELSYLILVLRDLDSLSGRLLLVFPPLHEHWDECDEFSEDNDRG